MSELSPRQSNFLFYTTKEGDVNIQVIQQDETVWLTQKSMSELFGVVKSTISEHLSNIYTSGELDREATVRIFRTVQKEGGRDKNRNLEYYNLDAIISLGYRVNSQQATRFRQWATRTLKEYLIKGFLLDDERLKQGGQLFGRDYFEEFLERIREIRASERRFYQKITDIYAQCSFDYDSKAVITQNFYKVIQNKLHWAITGQTAAEIIASRADNKKPNIGLTSWKQGPSGKIMKSDVLLAKNYLKEKEIRELNRLVELYLNFAELQAERQTPMRMEDWVKRLDTFLQFNEYEILNNPGRIKAEVAKSLAEKEYQKFRVTQDKSFESDFDKAVKELKTTKLKSKGKKRK